MAQISADEKTSEEEVETIVLTRPNVRRLKLLAALLLLAGAVLGWGITSALNAVTQGYDDKTLNLMATVVEIDEEADLSNYPDIKVGDVITVPLSKADLYMFQINDPGMQMCDGTGLVVRPYKTESPHSTSCGAIYVVLFE